MEKKLEKAQQHSEQQRNVIMQLKAHKCDMDLIKVVIITYSCISSQFLHNKSINYSQWAAFLQTECIAQQETIAKLSANVEQLTRSKATISSELAETTKKLEKMKSLKKDTKDKFEADVTNLQSQCDQLTERERKVNIMMFVFELFIVTFSI